MGVVEGDVERVWGGVGEVVRGEIFQGGGEVCGVSGGGGGEGVGLELVASAEGIEGGGEEDGDGFVEDAEEDEGEVVGSVYFRPCPVASQNSSRRRVLAVFPVYRR